MRVCYKSQEKIEKDNIWCNPIIATNKNGILFPEGTDKLKIINIGFKYHKLYFLTIALNRICRKHLDSYNLEILNANQFVFSIILFKKSFSRFKIKISSFMHFCSLQYELIGLIFSRLIRVGNLILDNEKEFLSSKNRH